MIFNNIVFYLERTLQTIMQRVRLDSIILQVTKNELCRTFSVADSPKSSKNLGFYDDFRGKQKLIYFVKVTYVDCEKKIMISCAKLLRQFLTEAGNSPRFQQFTLYIGVIHSLRTQNFPKNWHFLPPDTHTYVCV